MKLTHPERFGKWKVKEHFESGSHFHLFIVTDSTKEDPPERMLKTPREFYDKKMAVEAELLKRLNHPNIINYIDCDLEAETPYLVTEFAQSGSIDNIARTTTSIRRDLKQIFKTVGFLHSQGIAHNALTKSHIVICEGTPKLIHFENAEFYKQHHFNTSKDLMDLWDTFYEVLYEREMREFQQKKGVLSYVEQQLNSVKHFKQQRQPPKALVK